MKKNISSVIFGAVLAAVLSLVPSKANAAVAYVFTDERFGLPIISAADTTQQVELGYIALAKDPTYGIGEFIYVKFTGTTVAGDFVVIDRKGKTAVQLPNAAPGANQVSIVGIAMAAQATGQFGWVMIRGVHDAANIANAASTLGQVLSGGGGAAGRVTQSVANYILDGTVLRAAPSGNIGTVELYWPICSGR